MISEFWLNIDQNSEIIVCGPPTAAGGPEPDPPTAAG